MDTALLSLSNTLFLLWINFYTKIKRCAEQIKKFPIFINDVLLAISEMVDHQSKFHEHKGIVHLLKTK